MIGLGEGILWWRVPATGASPPGAGRSGFGRWPPGPGCRWL